MYGCKGKQISPVDYKSKQGTDQLLGIAAECVWTMGVWTIFFFNCVWLFWVIENLRWPYIVCYIEFWIRVLPNIFPFLNLIRGIIQFIWLFEDWVLLTITDVNIKSIFYRHVHVLTNSGLLKILRYLKFRNVVSKSVLMMTRDSISLFGRLILLIALIETYSWCVCQK